MAKKDTRKSYEVNVFVKAWVEVPIKAVSFESALEQAKTLDIEKVLGLENPDANFIDFNIQVSGVHQNDVVDL